MRRESALVLQSARALKLFRLHRIGYDLDDFNTPSPDLDDTASALALELREVLARGARRVRIEAGPPLAQLTVLGHLSRQGAMSTNDLAAAERVRPQSMTATVRALEQEGLIGRRPHPTDGRQMLIEMTPKGVAMLNDIFAKREDWLAGLIAEKLSDKERKELKRGLVLVQRIIDTP